MATAIQCIQTPGPFVEVLELVASAEVDHAMPVRLNFGAVAMNRCTLILEGIVILTPAVVRRLALGDRRLSRRSGSDDPAGAPELNVLRANEVLAVSSHPIPTIPLSVGTLCPTPRG